MRLFRPFLLAALLLGCAASGPSEKLLELQAERQALNSLHDFEIAGNASAARLVELEALHQRAPDDAAIMLELLMAWVSHSELFLVDEMERALAEGPRSDAAYHRQRVATSFARASFWGEEWLSKRAASIDLRASTAKLEATLKSEFTSTKHAESLLWLGHALLGSTWYAEGQEPPGAEVGALVVTRALALNEQVHYANAHLLLARHIAENPEPDLEASRRHFSRAEAIAGDKYLLTRLYRAIVLDCKRGDRTAFHTDLNEVLKASDPAPEVRIDNVVAKRRAQRWAATPSLWRACPFTDGETSDQDRKSTAPSGN